MNKEENTMLTQVLSPAADEVKYYVALLTLHELL